MKKFKLEKSRSSLWRESKRNRRRVDEGCSSHAVDDAVLSYSDEDINFSDENEMCHKDARRIRSKDKYWQKCYEPADNSVASDGSCIDDVVGWRWLQDSESESAESGDDEEPHEGDVARRLTQWVTNYNISRAATQSLLSVVKRHLPLPLDQRKLMKTLSSATEVRNKTKKRDTETLMPLLSVQDSPVITDIVSLSSNSGYF